MCRPVKQDDLGRIYQGLEGLNFAKYQVQTRDKIAPGLLYLIGHFPEEQDTFNFDC